MPSIFHNNEENSLISTIIFPESGGSFLELAPRVKLQEGFLNNYAGTLSFELFNSQTKEYVVKQGSNYLLKEELLEALTREELISQEFKDNIISAQKKSYYEKMEKEYERRVYECLKEDGELIKAVIVQKHGNRHATFIRYDENKQDELRKICSDNKFGFDGLFSSFETYAVLFSNESKELTIPGAIKKLHEAKLISSKFKDQILEKELRLSNAPHEPQRRTDIEAVMMEFNRLCQVIESYSLTSLRVQHGVFSGKLARPLRELNQEINKVKNKEQTYAAGAQNIIKIAEKMGPNHVILTAAKKLNNLALIQQHQQAIETRPTVRANLK